MWFKPINKTKNPNEVWAITLAKSKLFFFFEIIKSFKEERIRNKALIIIKFDKILKFLKTKIIIKFIKIAPSNIKKYNLILRPHPKLQFTRPKYYQMIKNSGLKVDLKMSFKSKEKL